MEFHYQILLINEVYQDPSDKDMPIATLLNAMNAYVDGKIDYKEWCEWYVACIKQMKERIEGGTNNN